jgi:uncharacterized protein (DUF1330 family)
MIRKSVEARAGTFLAIHSHSAHNALSLFPSPRRRACHEPEFVMPKAYWVVCYRSISDPQKLAAYAKLAPAATAPFGSRHLARGSAAAAFETGVMQRVVITEYPSMQQAIAAYESPAYQAALQALGDGAVRDVRIVEGLE